MHTMCLPSARAAEKRHATILSNVQAVAYGGVARGPSLSTTLIFFCVVYRLNMDIYNDNKPNPVLR